MPSWRGFGRRCWGHRRGTLTDFLPLSTILPRTSPCVLSQDQCLHILEDNAGSTGLGMSLDASRNLWLIRPVSSCFGRILFWCFPKRSGSGTHHLTHWSCQTHWLLLEGLRLSRRAIQTGIETSVVWQWPGSNPSLTVRARSFSNSCMWWTHRSLALH